MCVGRWTPGGIKMLSKPATVVYKTHGVQLGVLLQVREQKCDCMLSSLVATKKLNFIINENK